MPFSHSNFNTLCPSCQVVSLYRVSTPVGLIFREARVVWITFFFFPVGSWMPPAAPRDEGTSKLCPTMLHGVTNPLPSLSLPRPTCTQPWQSSRLPSTDESVEIYFWQWEIFHLDKTTAVFPVSVHKRNNRQMCIEWIYLHRILPYKEQWKLEPMRLPNHSRVFRNFFPFFFSFFGKYCA